MTQLGEVFGISTSVPHYTYVDRAGLDKRFTYLVKQDRHLVIHGASKQGKTILRKKNLPENECLIVRCGANSGRERIYLEILRQLGSQIPTEVSNNLTLVGELKGKASSQLKLPLFASATVEVEGEEVLKENRRQSPNLLVLMRAVLGISLKRSNIQAKKLLLKIFIIYQNKKNLPRF